MGIRSRVLRAVVGGSILSLAIVAGRASAQTTPVVPGGAATAEFTVEPPTSIALGGTADYTITIKNGASGHVTDLTLATVTLPTAPGGIATLEVAAVDGCKATGDAGPLPCAVVADLAVAGEQTVTVSVKWVTPTVPAPTPDDPAATKPVVPTTCPSAVGATMGDVTFDFTATSTPETLPPVTGAGAGVKVRDFADLAATLDQAPEQVPNGGTAVFAGTITNNGPCAANNATATFSPGSLLTFESGSGDCFDGTEKCALDKLAPGATKTFSQTYKMGPLPGDVASTLQAFDVTVKDNPTAVPTGEKADPTTATADPISGNNTASGPGTNAFQSTSGCSSGGSGSLFALALLGAAVFGIRRRRTA